MELKKKNFKAPGSGLAGVAMTDVTHTRNVTSDPTDQ
jgi:hypothetical protein